MSRSPHVVIDAGPAAHQSAGLSRYTDRLIDHLSQAQQLSLSLFYNQHSDHQLPQKFGSLPQRTIPMGQLKWRLSALASQLLHYPRLSKVILPAQSAEKPLLYHATEHLLPRLDCPAVMTVHDLIFERIPQHHTLRNRLFLKLAMPTFVRAADALIAVSEHSKRDLIELYKTPAQKITVIHEGVDKHFQPADEAEIQRVKQRYSPTRPYLLMVGTLEPRKNHATAIRALARLASTWDHQLVIAGGEGWLFEPIRALVNELAMQERVTFAGFVPDADLPALYSGAAAVLVPSLYEGFGFSVLEAMACGAPVITSSVSSLGEVAGDAALLLNRPEDHEDLAALVERIFTDAQLADSLVDRGLKQAAKFSWAETARKTAELYTAHAR